VQFRVVQARENAYFRQRGEFNHHSKSIRATPARRARARMAAKARTHGTQASVSSA